MLHVYQAAANQQQNWSLSSLVERKSNRERLGWRGERDRERESPSICWFTRQLPEQPGPSGTGQNQDQEIPFKTATWVPEALGLSLTCCFHGCISRELDHSSKGLMLVLGCGMTVGKPWLNRMCPNTEPPRRGFSMGVYKGCYRDGHNTKNRILDHRSVSWTPADPLEDKTHCFTFQHEMGSRQLPHPWRTGVNVRHSSSVQKCRAAVGTSPHAASWDS